MNKRRYVRGSEPGVPEGRVTIVSEHNLALKGFRQRTQARCACGWKAPFANNRKQAKRLYLWHVERTRKAT